MGELQEEQAPIDRDIASALIECIPPSWNSARLSVERSSEPGSHRVWIDSPEGRADLVQPTSDLLLGIRRLDLLFDRYEARWTSMQYVVTYHEETDQWKMEADFSY